MPDRWVDLEALVPMVESEARRRGCWPMTPEVGQGVGRKEHQALPRGRGAHLSKALQAIAPPKSGENRLIPPRSWGFTVHRVSKGGPHAWR